MKFRRKSAPTPQSTETDSPDEATPETPTLDPTTGPFDESQVAGDGVERVDLGSLLIAPSPGRELRLQVDEANGVVQAVMLAGSDGALELRAFAAPRNGDLWSDVREQLVADIARRGGKAEERQGRFGTELVTEVPVQAPDGSAQMQKSRIIGVNGDRWLLRATLLGRPAMAPDASSDWEDAIAAVVVRRGSGAMPVGEQLPATLPDNATRVR